MLLAKAKPQTGLFRSLSLADIVLLVGAAIVVLPTMFQVGQFNWTTEQGGHGPIVLATGLWLLFRELKSSPSERTPGNPIIGSLLLALFLGIYTLARITGILEIEALAMYAALITAGYLLFGGPLIRSIWFPLLYLALALPPPDSVVAAITQPIKIAISAGAVSLLHALGYPIASSGVTIQIAHETLRRSSTAAQDTYVSRRTPVRSALFHFGENREPDRGHGAAQGDVFVHDQVQQAGRIKKRSRQDQLCSHHGASERESPAVYMKHGGSEKCAVVLGDCATIRHRLRHGVQHQRSMRIENAFRASRGAGGEAHGGTVQLVNQRGTEISFDCAQPLFVILVADGHRAAMWHHPNALEGNFILEFLENGQEHVVANQKAILRMIGDVGDFVGMQAEIERVKNPSCDRHTEVRFQMHVVVPH